MIYHQKNFCVKYATGVFMSKKIYTSARGKKIDLGALQLQNEHVRAVGNMPVNARGDVIDSKNQTVQHRNKNVAKHYEKQTNVLDEPVVESRAQAKKHKDPEPVVETKPEPIAEPVPMAEAAQRDGDPEMPVEAEPEVTEEPIGLAAAIAKSRKVSQTKEAPKSRKKNVRI